MERHSRPREYRSSKREDDQGMNMASARNPNEARDEVAALIAAFGVRRTRTRAANARIVTAGDNGGILWRDFSEAPSA